MGPSPWLWNLCVPLDNLRFSYNTPSLLPRSLWCIGHRDQVHQTLAVVSTYRTYHKANSTNSISNTLPPVFLSRAWPAGHRWLDVASLNVSRCRWWLGLSIHYLCQCLVQSWPAQCNCWSRRLPNNYIDHWPTISICDQVFLISYYYHYLWFFNLWNKKMT